jgi:anhydro-N-acetylmuramic acid kinase
MSNIYLGVMSGTSLDGADVVAFDVARKTVIKAHSIDFSAELRAATLQLQSPQANELHQSQLVANQLADLYSRAINELDIDKSTIAAVGVHGQTIRHRPECGYTIQLNQPARIAEQTGLIVVSDFRARDIAAGGQGAPLVPAFHDDLWRDATKNRVILNIGGFANISVLNVNEPTFGYDTGPGNVLMDAWIDLHQGQNYDANGDWAASGVVHDDLLRAMLSEPYFTQPHPKSTGRDGFHLDWLNAHLNALPKIAPADAQATLLQLTAVTIANEIKNTDEVIVCGGGAYNGALLTTLRQLLPHTQIQTSDTYGINPQHVEAAAFAWLAAQTMQHLSGNLPAVTGAVGGRILGNVTI